MYIRMYVCMYVCMCVRMYCMYVCMYVSIIEEVSGSVYTCEVECMHIVCVIWQSTVHSSYYVECSMG